MSKFKDVITALVTPFYQGKIDYDSLQSLLKQQTQNGINHFVVNGTTGESPTLTSAERSELLKFVRKELSSATILMGTGTNNTAESILQSQEAQKLGADGLLVVVPYYNKPPQRGLVKHFNQIANSVNIPTFLYNVPGRTITSLEVDSISQLSKNKNIHGIKEASGNIEFAKKIKSACHSDFVLLSGDDETYVEFLLAGGHGVISVASHVIPKEFKNWTLNTLKDPSKAQSEIAKFQKLIKTLFVEANPIPVKMALYQMNIIKSPELRLPLVNLSEEHSQILLSELKLQGVL
jgi:4-hydroxy-tetrahydrodipicolinate synthase